MLPLYRFDDLFGIDHAFITAIRLKRNLSWGEQRKPRQAQTGQCPLWKRHRRVRRRFAGLLDWKQPCVHCVQLCMEHGRRNQADCLLGGGVVHDDVLRSGAKAGHPGLVGGEGNHCRWGQVHQDVHWVCGWVCGQVCGRVCGRVCGWVLNDHADAAETPIQQDDDVQ